MYLQYCNNVKIWLSKMKYLLQFFFFRIQKVQVFSKNISDEKMLNSGNYICDYVHSFFVEDFSSNALYYSITYLIKNPLRITSEPNPIVLMYMCVT